MKLTLFFSDSTNFEIFDFDANTALELSNDLLENIRQPRFITFEADGNTLLINTAHIIRIEFA